MHSLLTSLISITTINPLNNIESDHRYIAPQTIKMCDISNGISRIYSCGCTTLVAYSCANSKVKWEPGKECPLDHVHITRILGEPCSVHMSPGEALVSLEPDQTSEEEQAFLENLQLLLEGMKKRSPEWE